MTNSASKVKLSVGDTAPLSQVEPKFFSCDSDFLFAGDSRFDATSYSAEAWRATSAITSVPGMRAPLGSLCGTIWHPVQNQARSNFKRIYVDKEHGMPYVGSREMFFLPLRPEKYLSKKIPKLQDLMVPEGWLLISRSGSVGNVLYVNKRLSRCAITDDAIRIEPKKVPAGFLHALLASKYGQPLLSTGGYGSTISHLEPKHIATIPVPLFDRDTQQRIHNKIIKAYSCRDRANDLFDKAEEDLYDVMGVAAFDDTDIEYLGNPREVQSFEIDSSELGFRFDATCHIPTARSAVDKLRRSRYSLIPLGQRVKEVYLPPRFSRIYVDRDHGVPFLQGSHMPLFRIYNPQYISATQNTKAVNLCCVHKADVLVTRSGTVGRVGLVSSRMDGWAASEHMIRITPKQELYDSGFLVVFLTTPYGQHQIKARIHGGVVDELTDTDLANCYVPDVPISLQHNIGKQVTEAFELRDRANDLEDEAIGMIERMIAG